MGPDTKSDSGHHELHGTLPPGTRLRNYELISVLGQGAFGITYLARDTLLGRELAIKEYLPSSLAVREGGTTVVPRSTQLAEDFVWGRERFLDEARTLVTLESVPAVVRVYDYLEANGTAYMVMALARGETLEQRLKREGSLPAPIVERLLHHLLDGLEQVHATGFLHRDIKPANIILDAKNNPTLIDFGASRASMAGRTTAMTAVFTPRYAAAEQHTSDEQGPWTDIYGLSVTLYCAVAGRPPPTAVERILNDRYQPLTELRPTDFPHEMLRGIDAGLAVRAADRPQSIAAWRASFAPNQEWPDDATVVDRRLRRAPEPAVPANELSGSALSPAAPARVTGRKRGALYAGGATAAIFLAAGYFMFVSRTGQPEAGGKVDTELAARHQSDDAADAETKRQAEAAALAKAQAERQQAEAEARQKAEAEAKRKAEAEAQQKAEAEAKRKADAEAKQKADAEAKQKATPRPSGRPMPKRNRRPTPKPSRRPTPKRNRRRTPKPSERPTPRPNRRRTPKPSRRPTPKRNRKQTPKPSERPTPRRSRRRTPRPSRRPTPKRNRRPTLKPSRRPMPRRNRRRTLKPNRRPMPRRSRRLMTRRNREQMPKPSRRPMPRLTPPPERPQRRRPRLRFSSPQPTASASRRP